MAEDKCDIVALTVSVDFHHELKLVLEANHTFFYKWYIATEATDTKTIDLCKPYENVEVIFTTIKSASNQKTKNFNKGGAVRVLQEIVHKKHSKKLKLILDSDILLPVDFLTQFKSCTVTCPNTLYGAKRVLVDSQYNNLNLGNDNLRLGNGKGEFPFGFFHLYIDNKHYYENTTTAAICDLDFVELFLKTQILPIKVNHIGEPFINWCGRSNPKQIEKRKQRLQHLSETQIEKRKQRLQHLSETQIEKRKQRLQHLKDVQARKYIKKQKIKKLLKTIKQNSSIKQQELKKRYKHLITLLHRRIARAILQAQHSLTERLQRHEKVETQKHEREIAELLKIRDVELLRLQTLLKSEDM